jgi:hypothetical protein
MYDMQEVPLARRATAAAAEISDDEARQLCTPWWGLERNTLRIVKQAVARDRINRAEEKLDV